LIRVASIDLVVDRFFGLSNTNTVVALAKLSDLAVQLWAQPIKRSSERARIALRKDRALPHRSQSRPMRGCTARVCVIEDGHKR
jgi:hypothetical protein